MVLLKSIPKLMVLWQTFPEEVLSKVSGLEPVLFLQKIHTEQPPFTCNSASGRLMPSLLHGHMLSHVHMHVHTYTHMNTHTHAYKHTRGGWMGLRGVVWEVVVRKHTASRIPSPPVLEPHSASLAPPTSQGFFL